MAAECQLARAMSIDVQLAGASITVRADEVALDVDQVCRIMLVEEGLRARCQILACRVDESDPHRSTSIQAVFALPFAPQTVVVEHDGGVAEFTFDVVLNNPVPESPLRGDTDVVHGPVVPGPYVPPPGPDVGGDYPEVIGGGGYGGGNAAPDAEYQRGEFEGEPHGFDPEEGSYPGDSPAPERGRIDLGPPGRDRGGFLRDWGDLLRRRSITRDDAGAEAMPEAIPHLDAARPGSEPDDAADRGERLPPETPARFPRLDAPDFAIVGEPIEVTVGVAPTEDILIGGGPMTPPPTAGDTYILSVQLIADGFRLADGTTNWVRELAVTPNQPYPAVEMTIVAEDIGGRAKAALLQVIYTVEAQVIGKAKRALAVVTEAGAAAGVELPKVAVELVMGLPVGQTPADLTVVILTDETAPEGRLLWAFRTPHAVDTPKHDCIRNIGTNPEDFAEVMRRDAEKAEGKPLLQETMVGLGRKIASAMEPEFWRIFKEVSALTASKPTVLFLSEEPYVPWELAVLKPPNFPANNQFLAAEAVTGRWLLIDGPHIPPPEHLDMDAMAVVYGEYTDSRHRVLKEAKLESQELQTSYGATPVRATLAAVGSLLKGAPSANVLHFAIHGEFMKLGANLLMEDDTELTASAVEGSTPKNAPFVFLNACQVASGNELLGSFAGMAQAFLSVGASAVVAPLWSVRDDLAKEISLRFYEAARNGTTPAEILRQERASFGTAGQVPSATYLAYQFFGHPAFRLAIPAKEEQP